MPVAEPLPVALPPPPPSAAIGDVMADHFAIASWSRDAVIAGTLAPLREPLVALAEYRYDALRAGGWLPWIAQLQAAARLTAGAEDLDAAAMGVAAMTRICGECHVANGVRPRVAPELPRATAAADEDLPGRMFRHMIAAALLWQGIATPSDAAWEDGVRELTGAPAQLDAGLPPDFDADLREIAAIGREASGATTLADRADMYGLLLATCAGCHARWIEHGD